MIHTETGHPELADPPKDLVVRGVVDGRVLDTQAGQVGDGEEATVVLIVSARRALMSS